MGWLRAKNTSSQSVGWMWTTLMLVAMMASGMGFYRLAANTYPTVQDRKIGMGDFPPFLDVPREVINVVLLGQTAFYDDLMVLWLVQYLGGGESTHRHKAEDLEVVLRKIAGKKIHHEKVYLASCFKLMMDLDKEWLCEDILRLGIEAIPESWMIPAILGKVHYEQEEYLRAAEVLQYAGNIDGSPDYIRSIGTTILIKKNLGDTVKSKLAAADSSLSVQSRELFKQLDEEFTRRVRASSAEEATAVAAQSQSEAAGSASAEGEYAGARSQHSASAQLARPAADGVSDATVSADSGEAGAAQDSAPGQP